MLGVPSVRRVRGGEKRETEETVCFHRLNVFLFTKQPNAGKSVEPLLLACCRTCTDADNNTPPTTTANSQLLVLGQALGAPLSIERNACGMSSCAHTGCASVLRRICFPKQQLCTDADISKCARTQLRSRQCSSWPRMACRVTWQWWLRNSEAVAVVRILCTTCRLRPRKVTEVFSPDSVADHVA